jgi:hypothetical protein
VFPERYELGSHNPEDILHSHRRENLRPVRSESFYLVLIFRTFH